MQEVGEERLKDGIQRAQQVHSWLDGMKEYCDQQVALYTDMNGNPTAGFDTDSCTREGEPIAEFWSTFM